MNETPARFIHLFSNHLSRSRRLLICFIMLPALLGFLNVLRVTPLSQSLSFFDRVLYHLPSAILAWSIAGIVVAGIVSLTRAHSWGTLILCFCFGALLSAIFDYYIISFYFYWMRSRWPWLIEYYYSDTPILKEHLLDYLTNRIAAYSYVTIILANVGYRFVVPGARFLGDAGLERDALSSPGIAGAMRPDIRPEQARTPNFMNGVMSRLGNDLILLEAQEHYIKVITSAGSALVLYRLGNAVRELNHYDGDRVHRSFWIAWPHVREIRRDGRSYRLCMSNGLEVPVSRSHLGVVERRITE